MEAINVREIKKWNEIVQSMHEYDFYHLAEYHRLDTSGEAFLLYYSTENDAFALPVIVRNIEGTGYKDITSVYGYAGPLSRAKNPAPEAIRVFQEELKKQFDDNRIISVFTRLHPLFAHQDLILTNLGTVVDTNITVSIDLTLPENEQRQQYSRRLKSYINQLSKILLIREARSKEDIDMFIDIYWENMRRVNAASYYFFSRTYFYNFMKNISSTLLLAYYENTPIGGTLITECNGIIQMHLAATKDDYLALSPIKLLWDRARRTGLEQKAQQLHLGGGQGGKNDSLFEFKAQFSKQYNQFQTWKYIHNPEVYNRLVHEKYKGNLPETNFFPLYRF